MKRRNLVTNPSFELGVSGWSASGADAAGIVRESGVYGESTMEGRAGSWLARLTVDGTVTYPFVFTTCAAAVLPGQWFGARAWAASDGMDVQLDVVESGGAITRSTAAIPQPFYEGRTRTLVAQATAAATGDLLVQVGMRNPAGGAPPLGARLWVDAVMLVVGDTEDEVAAALADGYRDGSSPGWYWTGAPHASASARVISSLADPTMSPVPRINLTLEGVDTLGAASVAVHAIERGGMREVPGGALQSASLLVVDDFLATPGERITYSVDLLDAAGGKLGTIQHQAPVLDFEGTVVQHIMDPYRAVQCRLLVGSEDGMEWQSDGRLARPGSARRPIWVGAGRWPLQDLPLKFGTETEAQELAMRRVLGLDLGDDRDHLPILAVRTSHRVRFPQPLQVLVRAPRAIGLDWVAGGFSTHWHLTASEVRPPAIALARAGLTWEDVMASYATWDAVRTEHPTWADLMTDYSLAGAADGA